MSEKEDQTAEKQYFHRKDSKMSLKKSVETLSVPR